jgi:hypothetical protein|tara:strand:+ start:45 stop:281 length:237 start_codon:yes stop_codon:yes gene_type:complete
LLISSSKESQRASERERNGGGICFFSDVLHLILKVGKKEGERERKKERGKESAMLEVVPLKDARVYYYYYDDVCARVL